MSHDSAPVYEQPPTFDEVVKYAVDNGIFGKISLVKFYDYYGDFKSRGGVIIDWRAKLQQWANSQRSPVIVSAKEYEAQARVQKRNEKKAAPARDIVADIKAKVAMI